MHSHLMISDMFINTFDGSAISMMRRYLSEHKGIKKWVISADFVLSDPLKPHDCMAFSIFPFDSSPDQIKADIETALPKDIKCTKDLTEEASEWLRNKRRFHIALTLNKERKVFSINGHSVSAKKMVENYISEMVKNLCNSKLVNSECFESKNRFNKLQNKPINIKLLSNIWVLGTIFATLTVLLCRERSSDIVGWFPDRDAMTNYCDGIWHDFAFFHLQDMNKKYGLDMSRTKIAIAEPERRGGNEENMWFDHLIRSPDWFAGSVCSWNRDDNQVPGKSPKYIKMLENVIADAENIALFHGDILEDRVQFHRVRVMQADRKQC